MTSALFPVHTLESAPAESKPSLLKLKASVGMIPNLAAAMSESPVLIEGFATLRDIFRSGTFSAAEREVIALTNAVENGCNYCRAIHSAFGLSAGVPPEVVAQIRRHETPADPRLKGLVEFARKNLRKHGQVAAEDIHAFVDAGFTKAQSLEMILALAVSVLANYSGHFTAPPLDDALKAQA